MQVLLAEDDAALAVVVAELLADEGHAVTRVADLHEASALAGSRRWDAFVVDACGDSYLRLDPDVLASLRVLASHAPVVLTTARSWARQADPADLGVRAILPKPFDLDELARMLRAL